MGFPVAVRNDYTSKELRALARRSRDADQARRFLSLAAVLDGASRAEAAKFGGMDRQTLRDWVHRFNAEGPDGLVNHAAPGPTPKLTQGQKARLAAMVEQGPTPAIHGVVRWRAIDLMQCISEEFGVSVSDSTVYRLLEELGFSHVSARPKAYRQDAEALEAFKKNFAGEVAKLRENVGPATPIEVWFQDEMRVGQKNKLTYTWARRGTRPRLAHDQRTKSTYLFGAICPERGAGAALVLPRCNTRMMQMHLNEIATQVAPGAHAILICEQAGWHTTDTCARTGSQTASSKITPISSTSAPTSGPS